MLLNILQVSKRVSELILENHPAYAAELKRVMELQESLQTALAICTESRQYVLSYSVIPGYNCQIMT